MSSNFQEIWEQQIDALRPVGGRIASSAGYLDTPLDQMELVRGMFSALAQGMINYVYQDPRYPDFVPGYDWAMNLIAPVPDFRYKACLIDGTGSYRVKGFRGTTRFVDITIFTSLFSLGIQGPVGERISLDSLQLGPNGEFELLLSGERPEGYTGDWLKLPPEAMRLQVRHASYDWLNEIDARMAVERLDTPPERPRATAEEISERLSKLPAWIENSMRFGLDHMASQFQKGFNKMEPMDWGATGGFDPKVQIYVECAFDLTPDDALILETELPEQVRYWSFMLADSQFYTIDWINRQSSINGHQAVLDSDGRFRAVVSLRDPGVPNWLDTGGHERGVIQVRWNEYSSAPTPSAKKVPFKELRSHLPADTRVVTPLEREESLRQRRWGAQWRRRW